MKKVIWKFAFPIENLFSIEMPKDAKILTVQMQKNMQCIWVMVNTEQKQPEERHFRLIGTGEPFSPEFRETYIGTFQRLGGDFIFHLFEVHK
jgi:hypothetical protein